MGDDSSAPTLERKQETEMLPKTTRNFASRPLPSRSVSSTPSDITSVIARFGREVFCVLDVSLYCHFLTENWETVSGFAAAVEMGEEFKSHIAPDHLRRIAKYLEQADEGQSVSFQLKNSDGQWRWFELQLIDKEGRSAASLRYKCLLRDVTSIIMSQGKLEKAKLEAELAIKSRSEFLANMSHELRTPLNAIIGFSDVMRRQIFGGIGNERYVAYVDHIYESGAHLLVLINGILDLAKVEAGKVRLEEEPIDLVGAINTCINTIRLRAEAGGVDLLMEMQDAWILKGDHVRIKQVVLNLLTNAVKFTGRGGSVRVFACRTHDGNMQIAVADTGRGIRQEDIARAMAPFEQLETAYTRTHEGTGLGLPLAKALVELHGGNLDVTSALGVGTTVTITFPENRVLAAPSNAKTSH
jgi:signal transduction histidine kinase